MEIKSIKIIELKRNWNENLTRLVAAGEGLGHRLCVDRRRDLGKHSCNRS